MLWNLLNSGRRAEPKTVPPRLIIFVTALRSISYTRPSKMCIRDSSFLVCSALFLKYSNSFSTSKRWNNAGILLTFPVTVPTL